MALYAISDLHLGIATGKSMDKFGGGWVNHSSKIEDNWLKTVEPFDTVILGGDISWGMRIKDAEADLRFLDKLPGRKIIHGGNHDYWWDSTSKLNGMFNSIFFLKNNFYKYEDYAICASRGWLCPNDSHFTQHDEKIYKREIIRTELSFKKAVEGGYSKFILSLHFPPTNDKKESSGFTELIDKYKPSQVIYGHLHGEHSFDFSLMGDINGINYRLVSADYLSFCPARLM